MNRGLLAAAVVLAAMLMQAAGCAKADVPVGGPHTTLGTSASGLMTIPAVATASSLPERLRAVVGISAPPSGDGVVWSITQDGLSRNTVPQDSVVSVGRTGGIVAFWDQRTGDVQLWRPQEPSNGGAAAAIDIPSGGPTPVARSAMIALSPDETLLAFVGLALSGEGFEGTEGSVIGGNLVDVASQQAGAWGWLDSVAAGCRLTALRWNRTSTATYVSLACGVDDRVGISYRYDLWTRESLEITGVVEVFDTGFLEQVVGLGMPESLVNQEAQEPTGTYQPLVLWRDGRLTRLATDPRLVSRDAAWISDDGNTIVVLGIAEEAGRLTPCLEVLKLREEGWQVSGLFAEDGSPSILMGVGFEPNSGIFCFQTGSQLAGAKASAIDMALYELDTDLGAVLSPALRLPGEDDRTRVIGIVGTESCGAT